IRYFHVTGVHTCALPICPPYAFVLLARIKKLMFMKKSGLRPRLIIAIIVGILIGAYLPQIFTELLATFNGLFVNFLGFIIPLIIVGFIVPGIADLGKGAGRSLA